VRHGKPRLLLADDHAILLDSFRALLEPHYEIVGTVADGQRLLEAADRLQPDLVVVDIAMPGLNGLDAALRLRERLPRTAIVFLTMNEDPDVAADALSRGASAYILKTAGAPEVFEALRTALAGDVYLSPSVSTDPAAIFAARAAKPAGTLSLRQREVLQLLAEGRSMPEAATVLGITPRTIAFHKYAIMALLGVKTTADLVRHPTALSLLGRSAPVSDQD
jgi:DNA-binding NarL/FixJ family response regulator